MLLAAVAYPAGMGMGDVKLAAVMGLYLGKSVAPALFIGFAAGAVVGIGDRDRRAGREGPQAGRPVRALPGASAASWRLLCGPRDHRLVRARLRHQRLTVRPLARRRS